MTFSDIFKKSFLEGFSGTDIRASTALVCLLITSVLALYIFLVYRVVTRRTFYSKNFNISLAAVAVITAAIILAVQSSIVVSLGMVGALSIVRFRTAIKEPLDLAFMFWSISVGIICGAGLAEIAVILSLVITAGILILDRFPVARAPMLLVVNASGLDREEAVLDVVRTYARYYKVKSRNVTASSLDMVVEVRCEEQSALVGGVMGIEGVHAASLLSHDGEVNF